MRIVTNTSGLGKGDVLLVEVRGSNEGKVYTWRYYGVITGLRRVTIEVYCIGVKEDPIRQIRLGSGRYKKIEFLDPDEWPDGVHAIRARLILDGTINIF